MSEASSADPCQTWTSLSCASELATPFSAALYSHAAIQANGLTATCVDAEGADGHAALLLATRRRGLWTEAVLPLFTPFSALRASSLPTEASVHRHESWVDRLAAELEARVDRTILHLPPGLTDPRSLQWRGWSVSPRFTYRIPLHADQSPEKRFSTAARRTLRKHGDHYQCDRRDEDLADVISLLEASYRRQDRHMLMSPERLADFAGLLLKGGNAVVYSARGSEGVAAGIVVVYDAQSAYYWLAGSIPGPGMTVLLAKVLSELAATGIKTFDLVGANTPSIAEFKRRLGADRVPYFAAEFVSSRLLSLALSVRRAIGKA